MNRMIKIVLTSLALLLISVPATVNANSQYAGGVNISNFAAICGQGDNTSKGQILRGAGETGQDCTGAGVNNTVSEVIKILSTIVGVIAVIMVIVSGLKYVTSGGDSGSISSAKTTLIYALVGLAIAGLAQVLVRFVLKSI